MTVSRHREGASAAAAPGELIAPELVDQILGVVSSDATARPPDEPLPLGRRPYRELLQALGVAVYTTDADGRITFFNDAAAAFWGRRPALGEEWCGSWRLFWRDGSPMLHSECPMAIALKEQRPVRGYDAIAERPDGTRVAFVPYPTPLFDATGGMVGAVNVLVDITDRRRAEDALLASNSVKDEFLGLVSHELRTPVTTIFGNARLLRDRGDRLGPADRASMIDDIAEDSERLLGIIENLLLLTRLRAPSRLELEPQVLAHVVRKSVDSFCRRHPSRNVSLRDEPRQIIVEADRTHLELVMENLLGNADKYSPPNSDIDVVVDIVGDEARVVVLDRGIGLGDGDADKLFAPFFRTERAKWRANGIGIGLTVCKRIVESAGGRVWAQARDGGGTELGVALPLAPDFAA